jgi:selenocysteine-specific elongation factor
MRVIGTAGHVDHGKSTLVEALTGVHPDRLKEEREREMTIDLGFGWLTLPGGEAIGVVDVPGHIDFIENMLAGVGSIDAALFVVAADEGVMPQTIEHLAILNLLKVEAGLVALTKIDLVDAEWLELVGDDLKRAFRGTVLEDAPILPVSARRGDGVPELVRALETLLSQRPPRTDRGRPRLSIDRVFSIAGFGTVVTGTLIDGSFSIGDEVELLPSGLRARIRGLQTHKTQIEHAAPGSRVAINLSGVDKTQVKRGDVATRPGWLRPTVLLDARFEHLSDPWSSLQVDRSGERKKPPLKHNTQVNFFLGAAEVQARVRLIGDKVLPTGQEGWIQFELSEPLPVAKGDRFIVRLPSPSITLGGGVVIDAHPGRKHRRFRPEVIARLQMLAQGSPSELLLHELDVRGPMSLSDLFKRVNLAEDVAQSALNELEQSNDILRIAADVVASQAGWHAMQSRLLAELQAYHRANPLRSGVPREELKSRLRLDAKIFNAVIRHAVESGVLSESPTHLHVPDFRVVFTSQQQRAVDALLARFKKAPWSTPSIKEAEGAVGADVLAALIELGQLLKVSNEVLLLPETYQAAERAVIDHVKTTGAITVAQTRDLFNTSRKYALALMEYLDAKGLTRRVGDERVLGAAV